MRDERHRLFPRFKRWLACVFTQRRTGRKSEGSDGELPRGGGRVATHTWFGPLGDRNQAATLSTTMTTRPMRTEYLGNVR